MTENKKTIPEESNFLSDDQLAEVTGGTTDPLGLHAIGFKRCAADHTHTYPNIFDACPECGCREYTTD